MGTSVLDKIARHLESLGYAITNNSDEESFLAEHSDEWSLIVREFAGGILFMTSWSANETAKDDATGFLRSINELNMQSRIVRFYSHTYTKSDGLALWAEAWQPHVYDERMFGEFVTVLIRDMNLIDDEETGVMKFISR